MATMTVSKVSPPETPIDRQLMVTNVEARQSREEKSGTRVSSRCEMSGCSSVVLKHPN
jgi:hypothetical protein